VEFRGSPALDEVDAAFGMGDDEAAVEQLWTVAARAVEGRDGRELASAVALARAVVSDTAGVGRRHRASAGHLLETYEPILKRGSPTWPDWGKPEWAVPPPAAESKPRLGANQRTWAIIETVGFTVLLVLAASAVAAATGAIAIALDTPSAAAYVIGAVAFGVCMYAEARVLASRAYDQWRAEPFLLPLSLGFGLWGIYLVAKLIWRIVDQRARATVTAGPPSSPGR